MAIIWMLSGHAGARPHSLAAGSAVAKRRRPLFGVAGSGGKPGDYSKRIKKPEIQCRLCMQLKPFTGFEMVIHGVIIPEKGIANDLSMAKGHNCVRFMLKFWLCLWLMRYCNALVTIFRGYHYFLWEMRQLYRFCIQYVMYIMLINSMYILKQCQKPSLSIDLPQLRVISFTVFNHQQLRYD